MSTETTAPGAGVSMPAPPRENIIRARNIAFREDAKEDGSIGTLHGNFAVFNEWTEIDSIWEGRFMERIAPGAFKKTMRENRDSIKVLYDHGHDPNIGNKPLGPLVDLREDEKGGYYEVPMLDTSYNRDLLPGLKAGLYGASFRFKVVREDIVDEADPSEHNPRGLPERTIREIQLYELGPVTFPAYQSATAAVRSLTDDYIMRAFLQQPDKLRALLTSFLPVEREEGDEEGTPPADEGAEPEAHPVVARRSPAPLFGLQREETPSWRL